VGGIFTWLILQAFSNWKNSSENLLNYCTPTAQPNLVSAESPQAGNLLSDSRAGNCQVRGRQGSAQRSAETVAEANRKDTPNCQSGLRINPCAFLVHQTLAYAALVAYELAECMADRLAKTIHSAHCDHTPEYLPR